MPDSRCPKCHAPIREGAVAGLCVKCLMREAVSGLRSNQALHEGPSLTRLVELFPELEIIAPLGQGGMGTVYQVRERINDRPAALKLLRTERLTDDFVERFQIEAEALSQLDHPNIVAFHDHGQREGTPFILMEYVDGIDLATMIAQAPVPPIESFRIVSTLCEALHHAHEKGIIHRDIKPGNVLIDQDGSVKITDFGLARLLDPGTLGTLLTSKEAVLGTPIYMAPEQRKGLSPDSRADIYATGVVLYELLTGELPTGAYESPSTQVAVSHKVDDVLKRAMALEPNKRYPTADALREDLGVAKDGPMRRGMAIPSFLLLTLAVAITAFVAKMLKNPAEHPLPNLVVTTLTDEDDGDASPDHGDGVSLREAITYAGEGDTIHFDAEITSQAFRLTTGKPITIDKTLTIKGGDPKSRAVISGDADQSGDMSGGDTSIFQITPSGDLTLDSLVIRHGKGAIYSEGRLEVRHCHFEDNSTEETPFSRESTDDPHSEKSGGAIFNNGFGFLVVRDSTFRHNEAGNNGGAIYNDKGQLRVINATFEDNEAGDSGGAIRSESGSLSLIENCHFLRNNSDWLGGAVMAIGETRVRNCDFVENDAAYRGGAFYQIKDGKATLTNCRFIDNTSDEDGGAVVSFRPLHVSSCTFRGNHAKDDGGALFNDTRLSVWNSSFIGNVAGDAGGAFRCEVANSKSTFTNCTFHDNQAIHGPAIILAKGTLNLRQCTVLGTTESPIRIWSGSLHLSNSILSSRHPNGRFLRSLSVKDDELGLIHPTGNNLISNNQSVEPLFPAGPLAGTDSKPLDPLLLTPGDHGGLTPTAPPLPESPAIDAGHNASVPPDSGDQNGNGDKTDPVPFDQRRQARILGKAVDLGAVEFQP